MNGDAYVESLKLVRALDFFLVTAPVNWHENQVIRRYYLNKEEGFVSCVYWNNLYFITGTDIVRCIAYKMHHMGRRIVDRKKFEEGIFSDLRALKSGTHAVLEDARSPFLKFLHKNECLRTQKKQKVFFWFSVPHQKLVADVLERDLKREMANLPATTVPTNDVMGSFNYDLAGKPLLEQLADHVCHQTGHNVNQLIVKPTPDSTLPSALPSAVFPQQSLDNGSTTNNRTPIQMQQHALASAQDETFLSNLFNGELSYDPQSYEHYQYVKPQVLANLGMTPIPGQASAQMGFSMGAPMSQMGPLSTPLVPSTSSERTITQPQVISAANYYPMSGLTPRPPSNPRSATPPNIPRLPALSTANFSHFAPLLISPSSMLNAEGEAKDHQKDVAEPRHGASASFSGFPPNPFPPDIGALNSAAFSHYFPPGVIEDLTNDPNNGSLSAITNSNSFLHGKVFSPGAPSFDGMGHLNLQAQQSSVPQVISPVIGFKTGVDIPKVKLESAKVGKPAHQKKTFMNPALRHLN